MVDGEIFRSLAYLHFVFRPVAAVDVEAVGDAIAIVVSEETGKISIAIEGILNYNLSLDDARMILIEELKPKKEVLLDDEFEEESEVETNEEK